LWVQFQEFIFDGTVGATLHTIATQTTIEARFLAFNMLNIQCIVLAMAGALHAQIALTVDIHPKRVDGFR
jgi:hypothetical protein